MNLVFEALILDQESSDVLSLLLSISQIGVLSEKLLDARNKLELFLRLQVLIFVEEQLELALESFD